MRRFTTGPEASTPVRACALGSRVSQGFIYNLIANNDGAACLRDIAEAKLKAEPVAIETLEYVRRMSGVSFFDILKIDVEGAELDVLEGCKDLFLGAYNQRPKAIFIECIHSHLLRFGHTSKELINFLEGVEYQVECLRYGRWIKVNTIEFELNCDLFATIKRE